MITCHERIPICSYPVLYHEDTLFGGCYWKDIVQETIFENMCKKCNQCLASAQIMNHWTSNDTRCSKEYWFDSELWSNISYKQYSILLLSLNSNKHVEQLQKYAEISTVVVAEAMLWELLSITRHLFLEFVINAKRYCQVYCVCTVANTTVQPIRFASYRNFKYD